MQVSRTTLSDVARQAGVSKSTASRVLSGSRDRVSDHLTDRVLEAAAALDYVPNPHARALARASSPAVGVIVHDVGDPYFSELARGALGVAADHERLVMICATFRDPDREVAYVAEMRAQRIHAVLVTGTSHAGLELGGRLAAELAAYRDEGGRVTLMTGGLGYPAVVADNIAGGRQAGRHLVRLGHRKLAVAAGPETLGAVADRLAGFRSVVHSAELPEAPVVHEDFTRDGGERAAGLLFDQDPGITAVLALNDLMALGVVRYLAKLGRRVPEDVSVVGFDDIPLAAEVEPALTTVRLPMESIGAAAMELALSDHQLDSNELRVFPTELVVRDTTAAPGGAEGSTTRVST